ncbi:fructoselysine 6-phosphate deglycase [Lactiplantibacillus plantarum]|uniref:SIS domain-containing protein n=1 Tax=Lactobacillaceae TaxID=33958 RepID=UPI000A70E1F7|nr:MULTISPECIES: SIS domain-containing protein [Lactobacillaceae]RAH93776.1 phosphosugar isomerase [Lactiplantibacillus plantarum]GCD87875.1 fructoselysine 6-phosphate deglycase [Lactiplantibacillus plantarum]
MINSDEMVQRILKHNKGKIDSVYFTACGGSLVDMYVSYYFLEAESKKISTGWYTSNEFVHVTPKKLGVNSIVFICSHSGNTPEAVEAARVAQEHGALTIGLTFNDKADLLKYSDEKIVYEWGNEKEVVHNPMAIMLDLTSKILAGVEGYNRLAEFNDAFDKIDTIVDNAIEQVQPRAKHFAEKYSNEKMFYILGSGPSYGHAYGFAICSLMEMQWLDAAPIHSGEYFHGPFEVTDKNRPYIVIESVGRTRSLDERAIDFLNKYAEKVEIVDAKELGLDMIDSKVAEYFNPILFYTILSEYRSKLADKRDHSLDVRRYMGKVPY